MSELNSGLSQQQKEVLERILKLSTDSSAVALSEMTTKQIFLKAPKLDVVSLDSLVTAVGGYESDAISVCLMFEGEISGNILLLFPGNSAFKLVSLVLQEDVDDQTELDEMSMSVLGEVGNLVSSYFLTTLSDHTHMSLSPSPPMVTQDMIGAIVSTAMLMLARAPEEILYIETDISDEHSKIEGFMMLFTDEDSLNLLLQVIEAR
ncbi:MAG: chemotaxis protein CheC [Rubrobacteridae bacterium]|nr:chemotaxis protein CheC [Rubrobacteridae bacterium]